MDDFTNEFTPLHTWNDNEADFISNSILYNERSLSGDFNCDGIDEIVLAHGDSISILAFTFNEPSTNNVKIVKTITDTGTVITCGDYDADEMTVKYTGEKWTTEASPGIVVVMAAAPTYKGKYIIWLQVIQVLEKQYLLAVPIQILLVLSRL